MAMPTTYRPGCEQPCDAEDEAPVGPRQIKLFGFTLSRLTSPPSPLEAQSSPSGPMILSVEFRKVKML
jgi:hypothetical protein